MKLGIMQPYLFPYIGYFQLMNCVDEFIVYDNIEFTKKGWINRNRILVNGSDHLIGFPLKKASDYLHVKDRFLADSWPDEKKKLINRLSEAYRRAPHFKQIMPLLEQLLSYSNLNLFSFTLNSLQQLKDYLGIKADIIVSSSLSIDHQLKAQEKVIALCKAREANLYLNPIGGLELYDAEAFRQQEIELKFIKTTNVSYQQFGNNFVPMLSIIDVLMFNSVPEIQQFLINGFEFVQKH